MRILTYQGLATLRSQKPLARIHSAIAAQDFRAAGIKKLAPTPYWRAKLDDKSRLLMQFVRHGGETVCLFLEIIDNHAYEKSRFLRGARVDASKVEETPDVTSADTLMQEAPAPTAAQPLRLTWLHPTREQFVLLDKPIMFDDVQEEVRLSPVPIVVLGPAGSGKTAVTLTKLREASGRVLYVTQSAYLAQSARGLYGAHGYENEDQEVEFLSYREFLETIQVPAGNEVRLADFEPWFNRNRAPLRDVPDADAFALFEEFRGVIGARPDAPLSLDEYQALGVRQSLFPGGAARAAVHGLYGRYVVWLKQAGLYDLNLTAHAWQPLTEPSYDFVVIDEVQDFTIAQLALILATLKNPAHFLLCGDAHQIVHPNFFSWAAVRALFWRENPGDDIASGKMAVLRANFRNTQAVTDIANRLLKIKQARFGSVDRESNFLVTCASDQPGSVQLLAGKEATLRDLDARSRASVSHAVIVLRDEDKAAARAHFRTPLVFSVHEVKGLEYPHVILFNVISSARSAYAEICKDVSAADLNGDELEYRRARDKTDKSLEIYKFYVNALYVGMTRAVETLVMAETDIRHPLLSLLDLKEAATAATGAVQASTKQEWALEARKLELQGKQEQARAIRETFLKSRPTPWSAWSEITIRELEPRALNRTDPSAKLKQTLLDYALWHGQHEFIEDLASRTTFHAAAIATRPVAVNASYFRYGDPIAENPMTKAMKAQQQRMLRPYLERSFKPILADCDLYGVDHRVPSGWTPLMMAARAGNVALIEALVQRGADLALTDEFGHTAWMVALCRAVEEPAFAEHGRGALFELLAPAALDVQTAGRLVKLERHQAEYWLLSLMLASLKIQGSTMVERPHNPHRYSRGFFADGLLETLQALPDYLWHASRRRRTYLNHVLARAEAGSSYRPARKLWERWGNGNYLPARDMHLRRRTPEGQDAWVPINQALNLDWVRRGSDPLFATMLAMSVAEAPDEMIAEEIQTELF
jgi:Ankyrin repeat/Viral (Superfamily 1) RNA helicase